MSAMWSLYNYVGLVLRAVKNVHRSYFKNSIGAKSEQCKYNRILI